MSWVGVLLVLSALDSGSSARAHLGAGLRFAQSELYEQAAGEFEKALAADPQLTEARTQLAVCLFQLRDYDRARELFGGMETAHASAEFAAYYLGRIDLIEGNFESAVRRFRSIKRQEPLRDEVYYLGVAFYKQDRFPEAADTWKKALINNPRDFRIHQYLARAYQKLGREKDAEGEFAETRRLHDYYLSGSEAVKTCASLVSAGQPDQAWERCRVLLDTDDVDKVVAIGMVFGQGKQYDRALTAWRRAFSLDPESPEINYNLALTCFYLKDIALSRKHAADAVRLRPSFPEANVLYGTVLYLSGDDEHALPVLRRAHELQPQDATVRLLLAKELDAAAAKLGAAARWGPAADLLEEAASIDPASRDLSSRAAEFRSRAKSR